MSRYGLKQIHANSGMNCRDAFYDLDGKTRRAIALDDLVMAVSVETLEHEEDCRCGLCAALEAASNG